MYGIEVEAFAHELASVSTWISYFQWKAAHGGAWEDPILKKLTNIEHRDALLNPDGTEAQWPEAEFIVGNPPFLGDKKMVGRLGQDYTDALRRVYGDRLPGQSDLVCYWPEKARAMVEAGVVQRAGFVTTNSIRGGKNRTVLERVKATGELFMAYPDEPWAQDGAAVRVSLLAFDNGSEREKHLNGHAVATIHSDLSAGADVSSAVPLFENAGVSFVGMQRGGPFDIPAELAHRWRASPNPGGESNADVIRPWVNGMDLTRRPRGMYIIDFNDMSEEEASRYIEPFEYVRREVKPGRMGLRRANHTRYWWRYQENRPGMRRALEPLTRYIGTSMVAKHRIFSWLPKETVSENLLVVIARDDDFTFGVLNSALHERWARATGTFLGVGNDLRYNVQTCFQTFPFPHPTDKQRVEVEKWARYVAQLRNHLLDNDPRATLTGLYNAVDAMRSQPDSTAPAHALLVAHDRLDAAVAAAYGWEWPLPEDEVLARLLALNLERAKPRETTTA